jgi:hypothetical protein
LNETMNITTLPMDMKIWTMDMKTWAIDTTMVHRTLDMKIVDFLFFAHFVTVINPISLFSSAVDFLVELKACNYRWSSQM